MALNTEVPQWLVDTSKWINAAGERSVSDLFQGAEAVQRLSAGALAIQAAKNNLEIQPQMNMLKLQDMQLGLQEKQFEVSSVIKDQQKAAQWQLDKQSNPNAQEPAWDSKQYQEKSWQMHNYQDALEVKKMGVENQLLEAKTREEQRRQQLVFEKNKAAIAFHQNQQKIDANIHEQQAREQRLSSNGEIIPQVVGNRTVYFMKSPTGKIERIPDEDTQKRLDSFAVKQNGLNAAIAKLSEIPEAKRSTQEESKLASLKTQLAQSIGEFEVVKRQISERSPIPNNKPQFKPGQRVMNPKTGEYGRVNENGVVVPESAF